MNLSLTRARIYLNILIIVSTVDVGSTWQKKRKSKALSEVGSTWFNLSGKLIESYKAKVILVHADAIEGLMH